MNHYLIRSCRAALLAVIMLSVWLFPLAAVAETVSDPVYNANKISVQDLVDGQKVIIYHTLFNTAADKVEDYVIKGDGQLVKGYDKGDRVTGHSSVSPEWTVIVHRDAATGEPNGYYDFYNEETGLYLSPQSDGTLVSSVRPGVTLNGRRDGQNNSTIERWDTDTWNWYGYQIVAGAGGGFSLVPVPASDSQAFSFAVPDNEPVTQLKTVATVDSRSQGITIRMFDYPNRNTIKNVTGEDSYSQGVLARQHVRKTLGADGFPVFTNGNSGSQLFSTGTAYYKGEANHLFLQSIYNATGYYEYNSFNNYAYFDNTTNNFKVYQQLGTPDNATNFYYRRGNFLPYNDLNLSSVSSNTNLYDGNGNLLDPLDPTNGDTLYKINANFYFGMTVEANFMQAKGGIDNGEPVVFEFNGDDDLWVYVDGVLLLDIGGVHDAFSGSINFATGEIHGKNANGAGTIKECFRQAGVFPDGSTWDDSRVDEYFRGNTFVDYGMHTFNMFYMEHGAGASNLEMRFNLPVVEEGQFTVEKDLTGTNQNRYANVYFAYQAFRDNGLGDGGFVPLTEAVYEGTSDPVTFYDGVEIGGRTFDNVFYLKPGEAATFPGYTDAGGNFVSLREEDIYYVQELGVSEDYYDLVVINSAEVEGGVDELEGIYKTTEATVGQRIRVVYANNCSAKNLNELRVTKMLPEGLEDDGSTFEFRVLLENTNSIGPDSDGELVPYSIGPYYIQNADGDYFRYVNGVLTSNGKTPVVASSSGNNGTIAGIPVGYTVVIKNLLADTDFYVEEIRLPEGWIVQSKAVSNCDPSNLAGTGFDGSAVTADGKIRLAETEEPEAEVVFINNRPSVGLDIPLAKTLRGRDMEADEFTFRLEPLDIASQGTAGLGENDYLSAANTAAAEGEQSDLFFFPSLSFTLTDYQNAQVRMPGGDAVFYYVVSEDEGGLEGIIYSSEKYLVRVILHLENAQLIIPEDGGISYYHYDGVTIPDGALPPAVA